MNYKRIKDILVMGEDSIEAFKLDNGLKIIIVKENNRNLTSVSMNLVTVFPNIGMDNGYPHLIEHIFVEEHVKRYLNEDIKVNAYVTSSNTKMVVQSSLDYIYDKIISYKTDTEILNKRLSLMDAYLSEFMKNYQKDTTQERINEEKKVILSEKEGSGSNTLTDWTVYIPELDILDYMKEYKFDQMKDRLNIKHLYAPLNSNIIGSSKEINSFNLETLKRNKKYIFNKENTYLVVSGNVDFYNEEKMDIESLINRIPNTIKEFSKLPEGNYDSNEELLSLESDKIKKLLDIKLDKEYLNDNSSICYLNKDSSSFDLLTDYKEGMKDFACLRILFNNFKEEDTKFFISEKLYSIKPMMSFIIDSIFFKLRTKYRGFYTFYTYGNLPFSFSERRTLKSIYTISINDKSGEIVNSIKEDLKNNVIYDIFVNEVERIVNTPELYNKFIGTVIDSQVKHYKEEDVSRYSYDVLRSELNPNVPRTDEYKSQNKELINEIRTALESPEYKNTIMENIKKIKIDLFLNK